MLVRLTNYRVEQKDPVRLANGLYRSCEVGTLCIVSQKNHENYKNVFADKVAVQTVQTRVVVPFVMDRIV